MEVMNGLFCPVLSGERGPRIYSSILTRGLVIYHFTEIGSNGRCAGRIEFKMLFNPPEMVFDENSITATAEGTPINEYIVRRFRAGVDTPVPYPKDRALLIETGPYRVVPHPIYGGGILAAFGSLYRGE
jgi:hypothetical protein